MSSLDGDWGELHLVRSAESGLVAVVAIDDPRRGPARGGTRLRRYRSLGEAVEDAARLARAMSLKFAVHDLPFGGGKGVILHDEAAAADRELLAARVRDYGAFLDRLGGAFGTGPDYGFGAEEVALLARSSRHVVHGPVLADATRATALGVRIALEEALARACGGDGLSGRCIAVQGVGAVGAELARQLVAQGARVLLADIEADRVESLLAELGDAAGAVDPGEVLSADVDALAPCAVGEVLTDAVIDRLRCKVVAGAANNQLAGDPLAQAERLAARGVLFVPDFVASGGAAVVLVGCSAEGDPLPLDEAEARLRATVREVLRRAEGSTPTEAAFSLARERTAAHRARPAGPLPRAGGEDRGLGRGVPRVL
ncbi:MAG: Glu/Leu/Phe/Val dehydrogenase [Planctomycetota bacterium]|nr:MAG: Glu/Leu/Phe/Val dehydrogenase [Planctomycetota bacterium]